MNLPPLPEWSKCDDLGGLVPSEIRQELTAYARAAVEAALRDAPQQAEHAPCKGTNCGITRTDQTHSPECYAEHEAACKFDPLDTAGNRNPEFRYAGYKGQPLKPGCTADQAAAYREGVRAATPSAPQAEPTNAATTEAANFAGAIAYQLTKRLVIDMPTAQSIIDDAIRAARGDKL